MSPCPPRVITVKSKIRRNREKRSDPEAHENQALSNRSPRKRAALQTLLGKWRERRKVSCRREDGAEERKMGVSRRRKHEHKAKETSCILETKNDERTQKDKVRLK